MCPAHDDCAGTTWMGRALMHGTKHSIRRYYFLSPCCHGIFGALSPIDKMSFFCMACISHDSHSLGLAKPCLCTGSLLSHDCWKMHFPDMTNFNHVHVHHFPRTSNRERGNSGAANQQWASVYRLRWKKNTKWQTEARFHWTVSQLELNWGFRTSCSSRAKWKSTKGVLIVRNTLKHDC